MKQRQLCLNLLALSVLAALGTASSPADAVKLRRPFNENKGVNYGYDNNGGGGCTDFACGGVCYDGHGGTDFPLGVGTVVVATAGGTVNATNDGCANYGGLGNTCGGSCGNYVSINHGDGTRTLYCHMQAGSIAVGNGQQVSCGQVIGRSASSGNSSGPHLHLGVYINGGKTNPFAGSCSSGVSRWVNQGSYPHNIPSSDCENLCECSPGQVQNEGCGNCGTRSRSCGSDCHWGGFSGCNGQGECAPGAAENRGCCDCGSQRRECGGSCHWGGWSACAGPDPASPIACDTGEPGPCAAGQQRCIDGCKKCKRSYEPKPETCDDIDNDCSGEIDDGSPSTLGSPPPKLAARLVDVSHPSVLVPGQRASGWAVFRNEGTATWAPGSMWLTSDNPSQGKASAFYDSQNWAAYNVASVLTKEVSPGEDVILPFTLAVAADQSQAVKEDFRLATKQGDPIRCPKVVFGVQTTFDSRNLITPHSEAPAEASQESGSCAMATGSRANDAGLLLLALGALGGLRRRFRAGARAGSSRS